MWEGEGGEGDRGGTYHGHIANPTAAQIYPPLLMFKYRGSSAVMSVPALTLLAAMFVPSCASTNAVAMMKTPNRAGPLAISPVFGFSRK